MTAALPPIPPLHTFRRPLDGAECLRILAATGWGVLAMVDELARPYAVPVGYAWDGTALYVATTPGRKLRALEQNPRAALTLVSTSPQDQWHSLVVEATVHWVDDPQERMRAIRAFARQPRPGIELGVPDAGHLLHARIARLAITELAGRGRAG